MENCIGCDELFIGISLLPCVCGWLRAVIPILYSEVLQVKLQFELLNIEYCEVNI
jgi:hypothetical protein